MAKFRKIPVVIEACLVDGGPDDVAEIARWCGGYSNNGHNVKIRTLEGLMTAQMGDWIIKEVSGEFYPCKPDIFAKTYEQVE